MEAWTLIRQQEGRSELCEKVQGYAINNKELASAGRKKQDLLRLGMQDQRYRIPRGRQKDLLARQYYAVDGLRGVQSLGPVGITARREANTPNSGPSAGSSRTRRHSQRKTSSHPPWSPSRSKHPLRQTTRALSRVKGLERDSTLTRPSQNASAAALRSAPVRPFPN